MSCNHSHTSSPDQRCKALTLTLGNLEDRPGPLAAASVARPHGGVDTHRLALCVQPHQIQGHSHAKHVDRPRSGEQERVIGGELIRAEQPPKARAEGPCDVDHDTVGEHDMREAAQPRRRSRGRRGAWAASSATLTAEPRGRGFEGPPGPRATRDGQRSRPAISPPSSLRNSCAGRLPRSPSWRWRTATVPSSASRSPITSK